ncbi:MAG: hypothetical protein ACP5VP_11555 [Candidatus Limnocylindrales bacterium]
MTIVPTSTAVLPLPQGLEQAVYTAPYLREPFAATLNGERAVTIPPGEALVDATQQYVASLRRTFAPLPSSSETQAQQPWTSVTASELIVRDMRSGATVADWSTNGVILQRVVLTVDSLLFISAPDASTPLLGVYALRISSGVVDEILPADRFRGYLIASRARDRIAVTERQLGGASEGVRVVGLADNSETLYGALEGRPAFVSRDTLITHDDNHIFGYRSPAELVWTVDDACLSQGYVTTDETRLVARTGPTSMPYLAELSDVSRKPAIMVVDLDKGTASVVARWDVGRAFLMAEVSTDSIAVLSMPDWPNRGEFPISLLDLSTAQFSKDAYTVTAPPVLQPTFP